MTYILPSAIAVICTSVLFTSFFLMKYFSSRKQIKTKNTLPKITEKWWNSDDEMKMSINSRTIRPFKVSFSQQLVKDLQNRLNNTRMDHIKDYNCMQKILDYWKNDYDFKKREKYINQYMHFITNIQGLDIHFVHVKPIWNEIEHGQKKIWPMLMLHGWPNSILEVYKIIPLLSTPRKDYDVVFEVIVPSLPGFGFSSAPTLDGFSCADMCVVLKNLMLRLGHNQFYVHGTNWNAFTAQIMSDLFPEHVLKHAISMSDSLNVGINPSYSYLAQLYKQQMLSNKLLVVMDYFQIQTINPETFGVSLNDSPAGLAAYIIEKFLICTPYSKINDEFLQKYSLDHLIDNVMIYWTSKSITTAMRVYHKQFTDLGSEFIKGLKDPKVKPPFSLHSLFFDEVPKISALDQLANCISDPVKKKYSTIPGFEQSYDFVEYIWIICYGVEVDEYDEYEKYDE